MALSVLAAFAVSPLLRTGYLSEDATRSLLPGVLKVEGFTLTEYIRAECAHFVRSGRVFPLQIVELCAWFVAVQTPAIHKAIVVVGVAIDALLFALLVRRISGDAALSVLATCLLVTLFQFRATNDPILSLFGLFQIIVAGLLSSLLLLQIYLETGRLRWLLASLVAYEACNLMYEFNYMFCLMHVSIVASAVPRARRRLLVSLPFVAAGAVGFLATALARRLASSDATAINPDPVEALATFARQTFSAFPASYFAVDHASLRPRIGDLRSLVAFAATPSSLLFGVGVFAVCLGGLRRIEWRRGEDAGPTRPVALLGLLLTILPAVMISISSRHQKMIRLGVGYTPVYLQYFGVALLLAAGLRASLARFSPGTRWRASVAIALLVALSADLAFRLNSALVDALEVPKGNPGYNEVVGWVGGRWNHHRRNLEAALRHGLLEDVPDRSVLVLSNEYPGWHDRHHARYFYAMHGGKILTTRPSRPDPATSQEYNWFIQKNGRELPGPDESRAAFLLRDAYLDRGVGYAILTPLGRPDGEGGPAASGDVRVFVNHPHLDRMNPDDLWLVGSSSRSGAPPARIAMNVREMRVIRSGPDWILLSAPLPEIPGESGSLEVVFERVSMRWGEGFYAEETARDHSFRWSDRRAQLWLRNHASTPQTVKVRMLLSSTEPRPVVIEGCGERRRVVLGKRPVRFEQELTLARGDNALEIRAEGPPVVPKGEDARKLYSCLMDVKIDYPANSQLNEARAKGRELHDRPERLDRPGD